MNSRVKTMVYNNLTQLNGMRNCYLRSTDIEQKNWERLLWSVPDEMLFYLSLGKRIEIIDKSKSERGKIERVFAPVFVDLLNYIYFKKEPKNKHFKDHFLSAVRVLRRNKPLYTKYSFWKKRIKQVDIKGRTIKVLRERQLEAGR